jgi:hypothetical protein
MAHGDAREEKWRGNKRREWVASKRHMTAEHRLARAVQSLQADVHSSPATSRLNWRPRRFKWTHPFRGKTKSGFCVCVITFQTQSTNVCGAWESHCAAAEDQILLKRLRVLLVTYEECQTFRRLLVSSKGQTAGPSRWRRCVPSKCCKLQTQPLSALFQTKPIFRAVTHWIT